MQDHQKEFEVQAMCDALQLSKSGYYAWKKRPVSARRQRREEIVKHIRHTHASSRQTYGSPRICVELKEAGVSVCENTVARYMQQERIVARTHRRFKVRTTDSSHGHPLAKNHLDRQFSSPLPDRKCAAISPTCRQKKDGST
jgi:transposase InsO family protein